MVNVDQNDLSLRESIEVSDWYHPNWFCPEDNGDLYFIPPAFYFRNGRLCAINGRHRAVLLFKHMNVIPMLLVLPHEWPKDKLSEIAGKEIGENEIIELPDLPFNTTIIETNQQVILDNEGNDTPNIHVEMDSDHENGLNFQIVIKNKV